MLRFIFVFIIVYLPFSFSFIFASRSCFSLPSPNTTFLLVLVLPLNFGGHCHLFALGCRNIVGSFWSWSVTFGMPQHFCCLDYWFTFEWLVMVSLALAHALTLVVALVLACILLKPITCIIIFNCFMLQLP